MKTSSYIAVHEIHIWIFLSAFWSDSPEYKASPTNVVLWHVLLLLLLTSPISIALEDGFGSNPHKNWVSYADLFIATLNCSLIMNLICQQWNEAPVTISISYINLFAYLRVTAVCSWQVFSMLHYISLSSLEILFVSCFTVNNSWCIQQWKK